MLNKDNFSILARNEKDKSSFAIMIGLIGVVILLLFVILETCFDPIENDLLIVSVSLFEKLGEILIVTGFFIYLIEHNTIDKYITRDISVSIVKDLFRFYFKRDQMVDFLVELTQGMNQYENIPDDVIELYKKHGILELFNEPVRENLHIKYTYIEDLEGSDLFIAKKYWSYRATNTRRADAKEVLSKKINENGLIQKNSREIYEDENFPSENSEIEGHLRNKLGVEFYYFEDTTTGSKKNKCDDIKFISSEDFDEIEGVPKKRDHDSKNEFYVVYSKTKDESEKDCLEVSFYYAKYLSPGESIGIELAYNTISKFFNILILDFTSYTQGFKFELELGDEFITDIAEQIIGKGHVDAMSNKQISYTGWIIPHSSFSCSWAKKEKKT